MRHLINGPKFPGFNEKLNLSLPAKYLNIYTDVLITDWNNINQYYSIDNNSKLEDFNISYNDDGRIRNLLYKIISFDGNKYKHIWVQLLITENIYLVAICETEDCDYFDKLIKTHDFFHFWDNIDLFKMKPVGLYEWYEFSFFGGREIYGIEYTNKYFIEDNRFIQFDNTRLPIYDYYHITSFGMLKVDDKGKSNKLEGHGYSDYFFSFDAS